MQDYPLTIQHILWRIEKLYRPKQVITRREQGVHRYTYAELVPRVNQLANLLRRLGVGEGDRVATLAWNNYRHLELYYAVPCMGAVLHTLNPRLPLDQLAFIANDAEDKVLFVDQTLLPLLQHLSGKLPTVQQVVVMADTPPASDGQQGVLDYETALGSEPASFAWPSLDERMAAGMCYTSGTTGNPKGVVYSHRSQFLHTLSTVSGANLGTTESDVVFPMVPMFHVNSWGIPYGCGMVGSDLIFPDRWMGDGAAIVELASSEHATIMAGVPTIWMAILEALKAGDTRLDHVRFAFSGGAALPAVLRDSLKQYGIDLLQGWGMTETSPVCNISRLRSWHPQEGQEAEKQILTIGAPIPCVELRIADLATGEELPWDGVAFGEIQVRGPYIASGYYHDETGDKMTGDGWFRTGDVATVNADGFFSIVDRTKDVIKSGGEWISSLDLENAIMGHPKVREAAVIGLSHSKWGERPVAYVVPASDPPPTLDEINDFLRERGVAKWWLPDDVRFVAEVPKTSVGKFDKKVLRANAEPLTAGTSSAAAMGAED